MSHPRTRLRNSCLAAALLMTVGGALSACASGIWTPATPGVAGIKDGTPAPSPGGDYNPVTGGSTQGRKGSDL